MHDDQVEVPRYGKCLADRQLIGGGIQNPRVRHQRGRLRKPGGVPKRLDLTLGLVAASRPTVEAIERGRLQEQGS